MIKCVINCSTNLDPCHVFLFFLIDSGCAGSSLQRAGASLVAAHASLLLCALQCTGSVVIGPRLSCSVACGVLVLHQGSKPCPLHWNADSQSLDHQGSFSWRAFYCQYIKFKEMGTHSSIPAWEVRCTDEPGGLQSMGSQRVT